MTASAYRFGLTQFWNQLPAYAAELYSVWRLARIVYTHVHVECSPASTQLVPFQAMTAVVPASEYPLSYSSLGRLTTSRRATASGFGGMDKLVLDAGYATNHQLGVNALTERGYQQSYSEATSTTALIADTPVVQLLFSQYNGSNITLAYATIVVDVDVEFFELQNPGA